MTDLQRLQTLLKHKNTIIKLKDIVCDDKLCTAFGYNEWCVNEGADGNTEINVNSEIRELTNIINLDNDTKYKSILDEPEEDVPLLLVYLDDDKPHWYVGTHTREYSLGQPEFWFESCRCDDPILWTELSFS